MYGKPAGGSSEDNGALTRQRAEMFQLDRPDDMTEQCAQRDDPPLALDPRLGEDRGHCAPTARAPQPDPAA
ncbi:hypothetical protein HUT19_12060 [Streptomyces sp. NA02950]|uniref:hypothetical protein n=1 Tax=Streptomyces sp. NA02950 TaxID=2742137 RepID=UPI001592613D|nr:hypothetical protein HUT19_12060 [Streptomyces sp. NA02950]